MRTPPVWDDSFDWDDEPAADTAPPSSSSGPWPLRSWRRHGRPLLFGAAALLLALTTVALVPVTRTFHPHPARPDPSLAPMPSASRAASAGAARGYAFPLPTGWRDQTRQLAGSYPGVPPAQVLTGPASSGFVAGLSVLRQPAARPPSLRQLAASLPGRLRATLGATPVGGARTLQLGGASALVTDWTLTRGGLPLRVRQIACWHQGAVWWLTFTAAAEAFPGDVAALDQAVRAWRWTT